MKIGVIIGRLTPPHIGHVSLIKKSIEQNNKTIVILGSSNIKDEYNPFSFEERKNFLKVIFSENIEIEKSNDYETDKDWYEEIEAILQNYNPEKITFYGGDLENDSAIKAIKKFGDSKKQNFIEEKRSKINISATKIRRYLKEKKFEEVKKWIPNEIYEKVIKLTF